MSNFAKVCGGKVLRVIVAEQEFFNTFIDTEPGEWIQTSYNTIHNQHLQSGTPLRGNFAGVGYTYDKTNDVFYPPQPFASWTLNTNTWSWEAPVAMPTEGKYQRNESTQAWDSID